MRIRFISTFLLFCFALTASPLYGADGPEHIKPAPPRSEGMGPFDRLILRGVTIINGTLAPPVGPMDIVIEGDTITAIKSVGYPGVPVEEEDRPQVDANTRVMDLSGMYVLPGFVDMHAHIGGVAQGVPAEYVFKLWMGHGVTTIRDPGSGNGLEFVLEHKRKSAANEITAPRIRAYVFFGMGRDEPITTPEQARQWVQRIAERGADGVKFFKAPPEVLKAAITEATELGLGTAMHHNQMGVGRANVLDTARWGLTTMEHWYGLPQALFVDRTVQDYPPNYNYNNEYHRFATAGRLWAQAADFGSERWNYVRDELIRLGLTINPTFTIYEASRNLMAARGAEWHEIYTLPSLWHFFTPSRKAHGSYWYHWTTADEIAWRENYEKWMRFINDFKNHGGRVTTGSDSGFIYKLYGFGYIEELALLQEAGFHPLEVIQAATMNGAKTLGMADEIGSIEVGKLADLVVVAENPLEDFKVLYGTGAIRLNDDNEAVRTAGVRYTIKDGIVYDAQAMLADVREMVRKAKSRKGIEELQQPGLAR